jgi:hypothetical protein
MTVRTVAATASLSAALALAGCAGFYEIPVETPIQAKIDVTAFQRVLVAGFLSGGSDAIDANTETARLLRSQLRSKQELRVIDADALSLNEEASKLIDHQAAGADQPAAQTTSGTPAPIKDENDLKPYEAIFDDAAFWKQLGAEYQSPLIVTGTVLFSEISRSGLVSTPQSYVNDQGLEQYRTTRTYSDMKGYAITPTFVFIDGRTGQRLYSESYHEETLYPSTQNTPALSSYFELMDRLLPSFLNTLSSQSVRGTRVLLR